MTLPFSRRSFIAGLSSSAVLAASPLVSAQQPTSSAGSPAASGSSKLPIYKSAKWGMIEGCDTVLERFQLMKELGYDGLELASHAKVDPNEVRAASEATGLPMHGSVDSLHWNVRLSSPDAATREQSRKDLEFAIREVNACGGDSVLLVPGAVRGDDETHDDVWSRSIPEIRKVLPLASKMGVRVLIENVWNGFCETPEQARDYLDEIDSPWVGAYFDIGNCRKFGKSEDWIRVLGPRIVKLDVKDWGDTEGFCKIGDGDVDWAEVRKALGEIGFSGWATAEVPGGKRERLADISRRMDKVFHLA